MRNIIIMRRIFSLCKSNFQIVHHFQKCQCVTLLMSDLTQILWLINHWWSLLELLNCLLQTNVLLSQISDLSLHLQHLLLQISNLLNKLWLGFSVLKLLDHVIIIFLQWFIIILQHLQFIFHSILFFNLSHVWV